MVKLGINRRQHLITGIAAIPSPVQNKRRKWRLRKQKCDITFEQWSIDIEQERKPKETAWNQRRGPGGRGIEGRPRRSGQRWGCSRPRSLRQRRWRYTNGDSPVVSALYILYISFPLPAAATVILTILPCRTSVQNWKS